MPGSESDRWRRNSWLGTGATVGGAVGWHPWIPLWTSVEGLCGGVLVGGLVGAWLAYLWQLELPPRLTSSNLELPHPTGGGFLDARTRLGLLAGGTGLGAMAGWGGATLLGAGENAYLLYAGIVVGALAGGVAVPLLRSRRRMAHLLVALALVALLAALWVLLLTLLTTLRSQAELDWRVAWRASPGLRPMPHGVHSRYLRNMVQLPITVPAYILQIPSSVLGGILVGLCVVPWQRSWLRRIGPTLLLALLTLAAIGSQQHPRPFTGVQQALLILQALLGFHGAAWCLRRSWDLRQRLERLAQARSGDLIRSRSAAAPAWLCCASSTFLSVCRRRLRIWPASSSLGPGATMRI